MTKQQSSNQDKIAIIGAGITGLVTAYKLSQKGYNVTIFEKQSNAAGLASTIKIANTNIEKAYHHFFPTDKELIELSKELNIYNEIIWNKSSIALYYDKTIYPFNGPADLLKFKPLSLIQKIRLGCVILYLKITNNWKQFESMSAYDWLKKYCGDVVTTIIWEPLLKGKFHDYYKSISMAWMWGRLHTRANSRTKKSKGEVLGYFKNSFSTLNNALLSALKKQGVNVLYNQQINNINYNENNVIINSNDQDIKFDKLIATVPSSTFSNLIKEMDTEQDYLKKLNSVEYLGAVCIIFSSKQSLSPYYWHNINDLNSPFVAFIQHTNLINISFYNNENIYYLGTYLPHDHVDFTNNDETVKNKWFEYLKIIYPEFDESKVSFTNVSKLKFAQHIVDTDYKNNITKYKTPLPNVYLVNFAQIYPQDRGVNFAIKEALEVASLF